MISSHRITAPRSPAAAARERLLQDQAMRRNHADPQFSPLDPALFRLRDAIPPLRVSQLATGRLSPSEQRKQALLVARSLKGQYLSGIMYLEDCQTTVAIVRPIHKQKGDVPHQISVDAAGNVSVHRFIPESTRASDRVVRRLLLVGGTLSTLLSLLLIAVS